MKLCAIIAEYNPFHNGHMYLMNQSKQLSGCDEILVVMNSNFSQRGMPTIVDKETRAKMAICGGAGAVAQLPVYFSVANAEIFATAAVKTVCAFKDVTHLCFGSECGDIKSIVELAKFLNIEPPFFKKLVKEYLDDGYSLGISKVKALGECIHKNFVKFSNPQVVLELLSKPNNILGVEYVKALLKLKSKIIPITVKRQEPYPGYELDVDYKLSSSTEIRKSIEKSKRIWNIRKYIPKNSFFVFSKHLKETNIPNREILGQCVLYKLRTTPTSELRLNFDVVEGFENKLVEAAKESTNLDNFLEKAVSKRYSQNRVQRITTACLLNLRSEITKQILVQDIPFVKIVACKNDRNLIASLHNAKCPVVTRKLDAMQALENPFAKTLCFAEDRANSLFQLLIETSQSEQMINAEKSDIFVKTLFVKKGELEFENETN